VLHYFGADFTRDIRQHFAGGQVRDAAGKLDFNVATYLGPRFSKCLAMLAGYEGEEPIEVLFQKCPKSEASTEHV